MKALNFLTLIPFLMSVYNFIKKAVAIVEAIDNIVKANAKNGMTNESIITAILTYLKNADMGNDPVVKDVLSWYNVEALRTGDGKADSKKNIAVVIVGALISGHDKISGFVAAHPRLFETLVSALIELRVYFMNK